MGARALRTAAALALAGLAAACAGPGGAAEAPSRPTVVVTTSMLAEAVRAIPALENRVRIVDLVPPGSCPGHFDLRAGQLGELRTAVVILYPDYQEGLAGKLGALPGLGPKLVRIPTPASPLVPPVFTRMVETVAAGLERMEPRWRGRLTTSLEPTRGRLEALGRRLRARAAPMVGTPVAASHFQAELCGWLGLHVVAELPRNGDAAPGHLAEVLDPRVRLVVANLQEGTAAAKTVGERLGVPVVVLSAFPGAPGYGEGYGHLLETNLDLLVKAWRDSGSPSKG